MIFQLDDSVKERIRNEEGVRVHIIKEMKNYNLAHQTTIHSLDSPLNYQGLDSNPQTTKMFEKCHFWQNMLIQATPSPTKIFFFKIKNNNNHKILDFFSFLDFLIRKYT
jgi:hypothetical protein